MKHRVPMMYTISSHLQRYNIQGKTVLLRIDGNVPMKHGTILDDFKLEKIKATVLYIVHHGACCIVLTHLGNPSEYRQALSTKQLVPWFKHYFETYYIHTLQELSTATKKSGSVLLFENLRFFKEEKERDTLFARELASCGDFYVNDAFGTLHRFDTSMTLLPLQFPKEKRTIGLLVEKELTTYKTLLDITPSLLIVGGGKPETKLPLVIHCAPHINTILLCPTLSAIQTKVADNIIYPIDYVIETKAGLLEEVDAKKITPSTACIAIGSQTTKLYQQYIAEAKLIIWNGFMGFLDRPETLESSKKIASYIEQSNAKTIIAGADTCNFVRHHTDHPSSISHFSTGGGSSLALIARERLPGLEPFL